MCAPDPPPAPDYAGAAAAQGAANLDAARATAKLSNPNVVNPYGTQTVQYGVNGDQDQALVTQTFSPEQQALYNKQVQVKGLLGDLGIQGAQSLGATIGSQLDTSGLRAIDEPYQQDWALNPSPTPQALNPNTLPDMPGSAADTRDKVYQAMMSRVQQDIAAQRDAKNSELIAAGIRPGTAAYSAAMDQIGRQENDARMQAIIGSGQEAQRDYTMDMGRRTQAQSEQGQYFGQELGANAQNFGQRLQALEQYRAGQQQGYGQSSDLRRQQIAEMLTRRQTPLNEIAALMSGSQVQNPFAGNLGYQAGAAVQPAPVMQATGLLGDYNTGLYNAQAGSSNATMGAVGSVAAAAAMAF